MEGSEVDEWSEWDEWANKCSNKRVGKEEKNGGKAYVNGKDKFRKRGNVLNDACV